MAYRNIGYWPLAGRILKIHTAFLEFIEKKWKIGLKIVFGSLGSIPLEGQIFRIHTAFRILELTEDIYFFLKFVIFSIFHF